MTRDILLAGWLTLLGLQHVLSSSIGVVSCPVITSPENGNDIEIKGSTIVMHSCKYGYRLQGPSRQECLNGSWVPAESPYCVLDSDHAACPSAPVVPNARVEYDTNSEPGLPQPQGSVATVNCEAGYSSQDNFQITYRITCGVSGVWALLNGSTQLPPCVHKRCSPPPEVPNAKAFYKRWFSPLFTEGFIVEYLCSFGYGMLDPSHSHITCRSGQWEGSIPTCVIIESCKPPAYIENGNWNPLPNGRHNIRFEQQGEAQYPKFEVSTVVEYRCSPGYKVVGHSVLECLPSLTWSSVAPECILDSENVWYCPDIGPIKNGFCKCVGENTADLQNCMPFRRETQIQCTCLQGYKIEGVDTLTCVHSSNPNVGVWDWETPRCYKDFDLNGDIGSVPDSQSNGKSFNSADINDGKNKVSSLVIVVTTACSVLGVLLLIMVVVVFRRKKPRSHLFQQGPATPPYARVHNNSLDEHDRMALMAYADAPRVHLPTYEESMRAGNSTACGGPSAGPAQDLAASPTSSEDRRVTGVHPTARVPNVAQAGTGDGHNSSSNRHSTVTTCTMNRDGVSEIFGSLDTVNVSMSDASTSVTVETYDSTTSNRSMASQRATAGSLNSSNDHISSDDAPLLDSVSQPEVDVMSVHSNRSLASKDEA